MSDRERCFACEALESELSRAQDRIRELEDQLSDMQGEVRQLQMDLSRAESDARNERGDDRDRY